MGLGGAGQGTKPLTEELERGSQRGKAFTTAPVEVSLLACKHSWRSFMMTKTLLKTLKKASAKTRDMKKIFMKLRSLMKTRNAWGAKVLARLLPC